VYEDVDRCLRAVRSKDARFDGWFFVAATTTGIYCRPSCPGVPPKVANMRFFPSAAAAQEAGFRACKRCRPDASPGSPRWNERADLVARAMRLIADGVVDREGVPGLAGRLGYSPRQVQRQLLAELGAGPLAIARAQRSQTARLLVETTNVPMAEVAFAAGFASVRMFNDTVRKVFGLTPSELRARAARPAPQASQGSLALRLPFRRPFCAETLFGHLAAMALPGVEEWRDGAYRRTLRLPHGVGIVALRPMPEYVECRLTLTDLRDLSTASARCRWLLDLDADPVAVDELLRTDQALARSVDKRPGCRVPRTVCGEELAVRVVLGQPTSAAAARSDAIRVVSACGTSIADPAGGLTHVFPTVSALAAADLAGLGIPADRRGPLRALVDALVRGEIDLSIGSDWREARARLTELPGISSRTVETIAIRALGDPDAFAPTDTAVRWAARGLGLPATAAALTRHATRWRPWRAYAAEYLHSAAEHSTGQYQR
jgi:AraC family transcriptional regulator, regulatory protein of adaptative response / DNA-3-methyladenine glycosylase II